MEKLTVQIETEYITLTNLLKYAGVVMSGGQAHELIEAGFVSLNGQKVLEKRKKSVPVTKLPLKAWRLLL